MIPKRLKYMMCYGSALDKLLNSNYDKISAYYNLTALTGSTKKASSGYNIGTMLSGLTSLATVGVTAALTSSKTSSGGTDVSNLAVLQQKYEMSKAKCSDLDQKISKANDELTKLNQDKAICNLKDAIISNKECELNKKANITDISSSDITANIAAYNVAVATRSKYEAVKTQFPSLMQDISTAETSKAAADTEVKSIKSEYDSFKNSRKGVGLSNVQPGKAETAVESADYGVLGEFADMDKRTDLKNAKELDNKYFATLIKQNEAETALKTAEKAKETALSNAALSTSINNQDGIETAIANIRVGNSRMTIEAFEKLNASALEFNNAQTSDTDSKDGMTIKDYILESNNINDEKNRIVKLSSETLEGNISTKMSEIIKLKNELAAAKKERDSYKSELESLSRAMQDVQQEKTDYDTAKSYGKDDSSKRNWLQKLFGANKNERIKVQKNEYKEALKKYEDEYGKYGIDYDDKDFLNWCKKNGIITEDT